MYDKRKVIPGLIIFLVLVTFPFWNKLFSGQGANRQIPAPVVKLPAGITAKECVEDRAYMRAKHMVLLDNWRNEAVRENKKIYINSRGEHFNKSLTGTCLKCHSNKEEFCDNCHKSAGVKPYCFDCHLSGENLKTDQRDQELQSQKKFHPVEKGEQK